MITPDVPAASLGVLAAFSYWRWLRNPTWNAALLAGGSLGIAELTKMTWIILFALWPIIWIVVRTLSARTIRSADLFKANSAECSDSTTSTRTGYIQPAPQLALILLTGVYIINLGYGFDRSFCRLDSFPFLCQTLSGDGASSQNFDPDNRFVGTWLGAIPVPLPYDYLAGLDLQKHEFEVGKMSYLRGKYKDRGWWYYYLYAAAVKLPIGTLLLVPLAGLIAIRRQSRLSYIDSLPLIVPPLIVFVLVSSQTGFSRYFRYVLPSLPFMFIWVSRVGALKSLTVGMATATQKRLLQGCRGVWISAFAWSVCSSLYFWPHSLSYFNEIAGGPRHGHDHLIDANIDWGQDLFYLREWIYSHPEARPLSVTYKGTFAPEAAGVCFPRTPELPLGATRQVVLQTLRPGWHAVSVSYLRHPDHIYDYFQMLEPVFLAGYSIYIYHITDEDIARISSHAK